MTITTDSYMNIILPENISKRIEEFMRGNENFPFIESNELICILYLYGRKNKIIGKEEVKKVIDLAERTVTQITRDIEVHKNRTKAVMDSEFIRNRYIKRELQIVVENEGNLVKERLSNDPITLSDCFVQHISYYEQEYFFHIYGPLTEKEVIKELRNVLEGRMVMIGFNRKNEQSLPFYHPLMPLYIYLKR